MAKKITLIEAHDYKKLQSVTIEPGDTSLMLISGKNKQGKSSLLGAMTTAIRGVKAAAEEPIRRGQKKASVRVVYDDGDLTVRRKFTAKGSTLELTGPKGKKISSPQKVLDSLVGKCFIDPMAFTRLSGIEQRRVLLGCVDIAINLDENLADEKRAYDERRDANREIKKLEAKLDDRSFASIPEEKDANDIIQTIEALNNRAREIRSADAAIAKTEAEVAAAAERVEIAKNAFVAARDELKAAKEALDEKRPQAESRIAGLRELATLDVSEKLTAAKTELDHCSEHNGEVAQLRAEKAQHEAMEKELREVQDHADSLTTEIDRAKADRTDALAEAKMPIDGLSLVDDGLVLHGAPFYDASGAEKLIASIGIALALAPELADVWVQDASLLDSDALVLLRQFAEERDVRIWLELVGEDIEGAVVMVDGEVKS